MNSEVFRFNQLQYLVTYPSGYAIGQKYPVIIFLHGAGTRGNQIELLRNNPFFKITENNKNFPFITIAPLCAENTWFDIFEELIQFVRQIISKEYVEPSKVYLMGASMGGYATWQLAMSIPEYFAAIVPICGGGMYWNAGRLTNVPIWAFHGAKDNVVFVEETIKMTNAVNQNGGNARVTIYTENGHDAWSDTYGNPDGFEWLLTCERNEEKRLVEHYKDSKVYG